VQGGTPKSLDRWMWHRECALGQPAARRSPPLRLHSALFGRTGRRGDIYYIVPGETTELVRDGLMNENMGTHFGRKSEVVKHYRSLAKSGIPVMETPG